MLLFRGHQNNGQTKVILYFNFKETKIATTRKAVRLAEMSHNMVKSMSAIYLPLKIIISAQTNNSTGNRVNCNHDHIQKS